MIKNYAIIFILLTTTLWQCNSKEKFTYLSGSIQNSKQGYVLLTKGKNRIIDTLRLDKEQHFSTKLKLEEGLYTLLHGAELQYVYLNPGAHTIIKFDANNIDGITFEGDNAQKNKIFIENILKEKENNKFFKTHYHKDYQDFRKVYDSVLEAKQNYLKTYKANNNVSDIFMEILEIATIYNIYAQLEFYSLHHLKNDLNKVSYKDIQENRKHMDLSRDDYMSFIPYYRMMIVLITNDIYLQGYKNNTDNFTSVLIRALDKKVKDPIFKDPTITGLVKYFVLRKKSSESIDKTIEAFNKAVKNEGFDKFFNCVSHYDREYKLKGTVSNFKVYDDSKTINIKELIKGKKSVLLFNNPHYPDWVIAKQMNGLMKDFPELNYIVINKEKKQEKDVFGTGKVVYVHEDNKTNDCSDISIPMLLLVDENGVISSPFITPFSKDLKSQLLKLSQNEA